MPPANFLHTFASDAGAGGVDVRTTAAAVGGLLDLPGALTALGHGRWWDGGSDQQHASMEVDGSSGGGGDGLMLRANADLTTGIRVRVEHTSTTRDVYRTEYEWKALYRAKASGASTCAGAKADIISPDHYHSSTWATEYTWGSYRSSGAPATKSHVHTVWFVYDDFVTCKAESRRHSHSKTWEDKTGRTRRVYSSSPTTHYWSLVVEALQGGAITLLARVPLGATGPDAIWAEVVGYGSIRAGVGTSYGSGVKWQGSNVAGAGNHGVAAVRARSASVDGSLYSGSAIDNFDFDHRSTAPNAPVIVAPADGAVVDVDADPVEGSWKYMHDTEGSEQGFWAARVNVDGGGYSYYDDSGPAPTLVASEVKHAGATESIDLAAVLANGQTVSWSPKSWSTDDVEGVYAPDVTFETTSHPTVSWVAPADGAALTETALPLFVWEVQDAEGDPHAQSRLKIFSEQATQQDDFDPESSLPLYDSGQLGPVLSHTPASPLANHGGYVAYVRATTSSESIWTPTGFRVALQGPAEPALVARYDPNRHMVLVTTSVGDNLLTTDEAGFESGYGTWSAQNASLDHVVDSDVAIDQAGSMQVTADAAGAVVLEIEKSVVAGAVYAAGMWLLDRGGPLMVDAIGELVWKDSDGNVLRVDVGDYADQDPADPTPPGAPAYGIVVSEAPDRSNPTPLDGAVFGGIT